MRIAFYKVVRPGLDGIYSRAVRLWTNSEYSHCELIFSDGQSASASYLDGGVRFKTIDFKTDNWDIFELPFADESYARAWFEAHNGQGYDVIGNIRFVIPFLQNQKNHWFCSEAIAEALKMTDSWRYDPQMLKLLLTFTGEHYGSR